MAVADCASVWENNRPSTMAWSELLQHIVVFIFIDVYNWDPEYGRVTRQLIKYVACEDDLEIGNPEDCYKE